MLTYAFFSFLNWLLVFISEGCSDDWIAFGDGDESHSSTKSDKSVVETNPQATSRSVESFEIVVPDILKMVNNGMTYT